MSAQNTTVLEEGKYTIKQMAYSGQFGVFEGSELLVERATLEDAKRYVVMLKATESVQHKPLPVKGYSAQSLSNVVRVNGFKDDEERILRKLDDLQDSFYIDQRWLAIGRTQLEQAFMAINRSIFKPGRVNIQEDEK